MASVSNESYSLKKVGCLPQVGFRAHRVLAPGISAQVGGEPSFLPMCPQLAHELQTVWAVFKKENIFFK